MSLGQQRRGRFDQPSSQDPHRGVGTSGLRLLTVRGGTVSEYQATEGMDGTRKYAWYSGPPQGGPDIFLRCHGHFFSNSTRLTIRLSANPAPNRPIHNQAPPGTSWVVSSSSSASPSASPSANS